MIIYKSISVLLSFLVGILVVIEIHLFNLTIKIKRKPSGYMTIKGIEYRLGRPRINIVKIKNGEDEIKVITTGRFLIKYKVEDSIGIVKIGKRMYFKEENFFLEKITLFFLIIILLFLLLWIGISIWFT